MIHRSVIVFTLLSIAVFGGLMVYGDFDEFVQSILVLPAWYWLLALVLTVFHLLVRLVRWNYYLKALHIRADAATSALIFLAGLSAIMIPGRVGELAKSYFMKYKLDAPVRLTAPVVVVERVVDVISVALLGLWGLVYIPYGWIVAVVLLAGVGALAALLISGKGVGLLLRLPLVRKWESVITDSGQAFRTLFSPRVALVGLVLGGVSWFALGFAFWMVVRGLNTSMDMPMAVSIFCAATLLGSITMLPGGLVGTEGGMLALLQRAGLAGSTASASIVIIRVCTLWFAVLLGLAAMFHLQRHQPSGRPSSVEVAEMQPVAGDASD